jgi:phosphoribosylformimino-5-aminoimidazole carboxamide ribotide isomerase
MDSAKTSQLPLIPVMDIRQGHLVHACAGQRQRYLPLHSPLVGSTLLETAQRLCRAAGSQRVYVADLDALLGESTNAAITELLGQLHVDEILLDRGRALDPTLPQHVRPILPLEANWSAQEHAQWLTVLQQRRPIFSLDLYRGQMLNGHQAWSIMEPCDIPSLLRQAYGVGYRSFLVLDLAYVGMAQGVSALTPVVSSIRQLWPEVEIIAGGGIRDEYDCHILLNAGADALLVATALHKGWLGHLC